MSAQSATQVASSAIPVPLPEDGASGRRFPPYGPAAVGARPGLPWHALPLLRERSGGERAEAEHFIRERYAEAYGACLEHFMPRLFSVEDEGGRLVGALGVRVAAEQPLFLERYLGRPIEQVIAEAGTGEALRTQVVEVGQFAGTGPGAFRSMIAGLTAVLHREGYRWVCFTGTRALRNAFHRLGLAPRDLGAADPGCLGPAEQAAWGSYYAHAPRVVFGDIGEGYAALSLRGEGCS